MTVAQSISRRSECVRAGIGAVIVGADQRIVATGYNGPPAGFASEFAVVGRCENFCPRAFMSEPGISYENCVSVHAEMNAIAYADRSRMQGGSLYVTGSICWDCAKVVANSGISRVLFIADRDRDTTKVVTFLFRSGLEAEPYDVSRDLCQ